MVSYFNIKVGSPDVFGTILRADLGASKLEEQLVLLDENCSWDLRLLKSDKSGSRYEFIAHDTKIVAGVGKDALGGRIGVPVIVHNGPDTIAQLVLTLEGEVCVAVQGNKPIYITPLSEKAANDLVKSAELWRLEQAYLLE